MSSSLVNRLEIQSVTLVFSTGFVNYAPLTFSLVSSPPPLPCVNKYTVLYTRKQCLRGWVMESQEVECLRQIKQLLQTLFTCQFFQITIFGIAFYQSNLSTLTAFTNLLCSQMEFGSNRVEGAYKAVFLYTKMFKFEEGDLF